MIFRYAARTIFDEILYEMKKKIYKKKLTMKKINVQITSLSQFHERTVFI
jgi:hypothetical protein